jgi:hypothetical protein
MGPVDDDASCTHSQAAYAERFLTKASWWFSCIRRRFSLMIDRAILNGALLPYQSGIISKCSRIHSFLVLEGVHSPFHVISTFLKWRPHLLLAICLQSLPWGTLHLENDQSSERFASQSLQASRIIVVTNTTRLPSSAQRVVAFLFPSRGLFLWNSQKKVDSSSHVFTAVWLLQTKGHAKLLWTLIMSNLLLLWWKWQDLVPPPSSPHLLPGDSFSHDHQFSEGTRRRGSHFFHLNLYKFCACTKWHLIGWKEWIGESVNLFLSVPLLTVSDMSVTGGSFL